MRVLLAHPGVDLAVKNKGLTSEQYAYAVQKPALAQAIAQEVSGRGGGGALCALLCFVTVLCPSQRADPPGCTHAGGSRCRGCAGVKTSDASTSTVIGRLVCWVQGWDGWQWFDRCGFLKNTPVAVD